MGHFFKDWVQTTTQLIPQTAIQSEVNYTQVRELYLSYTEDERQRLYDNIAVELSRAYDFIQKRAYDMFYRVHKNYGTGVRKAVAMAMSKRGDPQGGGNLTEYLLDIGISAEQGELIENEKISEQGKLEEPDGVAEQ